MSDSVKTIAEVCATFIEFVGIALIVLLATHALIWSLLEKFRGRSDSFYVQTRHRLGRGILLGLEFLVAADIIHTVAVELTFETVGILAVIVLIRTFLSFTLEVELKGRWPWQAGDQ